MLFFFLFNESTDNSIVESLALIIFHEFCLDKSRKLIEIFYFNQIETGIEIFSNKSCQVTFSFEYRNVCTEGQIIERVSDDN